MASATGTTCWPRIASSTPRASSTRPLTCRFGFTRAFFRCPSLALSVLQEAFGTEDQLTIMQEIAKTGEVQTNAADRKKAMDDKRKQVINYLHKLRVLPAVCKALTHTRARIGPTQVLRESQDAEAASHPASGERLGRGQTQGCCCCASGRSFCLTAAAARLISTSPLTCRHDTSPNQTQAILPIKATA